MVLVNLMERDWSYRGWFPPWTGFNCCKPIKKCKKDNAAPGPEPFETARNYVVMKEGDQEKRSRQSWRTVRRSLGALVQAILVVKKEP